MVSTGPAATVDRWRKEVPQGHAEPIGETGTDLLGRVDSEPDLTTPRPGHRHNRQPGDPVGHCRDHEIGEPGQAAVFESVHQIAGRTLVLECGNQPYPPVEDALRCGVQ